MGPLSLTNVLHSPLFPPQIVTHHVSDIVLFNYWARSLPIVIGATNRYILSCPVKIATYESSTPAEIGDRHLQMLSTSVLDLLQKNYVLKELDRGHIEQVPFESVSLEGTKIEWYNLIGDMMLPATPVAGQPRPTIEQEIRPLSLDVRQAIVRLIDTVSGPWKGKIFLHNLDEIPLCPACQVPDTTKPAVSGITFT